MCFSAAASFSTAVILIPAGIYCLKESNQIDKRYWAFAMLPLIFGVQQLFEGGVWLALTHDREVAAHNLALGFLLFSHVFWLGWVAYSSYLTESSVVFRRIFLMAVFLGLMFGVLMYVPLLFNPEWLSVSIKMHSIDYELVFLSDTYVSQHVLAGLYAMMILIPLMLSSDRYHSVLGVMIFLSGIISVAFFDWVFISVWCYFAAIISLYIFYIMMHSSRAVSMVSIKRTR